ncbi:RICIN domain-containing protein [Roseateles albus]|uniref:Ricin-type beta-trefoil lectin domain protein n=1 Tax=Roseateles albus TaxID=2987525 RepID=A0ABT5K901_9BURK|nr:ricin-type beta-trefoil lectin domain protein [Roseateles albus]MDC8770074.1 ricin-type beta-trefoil lectin domain protein [Roseateles albus]
MNWFSRFLITLLASSALASAHAADTSYNLVASNGQCLDSSGALSSCGGAEQRFAFGADGTVYLAGGEGKRYLQGNLFASKTVSFSGALSTGNASTYWSRPGGNQLQLSQSRAMSAMCLSWQLVGTVKSGLSSGNPGVLSAELALCSATAANQKWTLANPLPVDLADPSKTQVRSSTRGCLQQTDFTSPPAASKLTVSACAGAAKSEYFRFTNQGSIVLNGYCLTASGGAGTAVGLSSCGETGVPPAANQKWKRGSNSSIVSPSGLCLSQKGASVELAACDAGNVFQYWSTSSIVASTWPQGVPVADKPTTYVPGQKLSNGQVNTIVNWIQRETSISSTPFCYKTAAYDRGIGIAPGCADGQYKDGALCYSNCRSGYHPVGPVCWSNQSLSYQPGYRCTAKDALGTCWAWAMNGCRDGYTSDRIGTCWLTKSSYGNGAGSAANSCKSNREMQAGLCYLKPRDGYQCNVTNCNQRCAKGIADCGAAACASNANQCVNTISNMVVSSAMMIGSFATAGAIGEAKIGVMAAKDVYKAAKTADELATALVLLSNDINNFLNLAEKDLASISSADIEAKIAAKYPRDSADYRHIAREWAARQLLFYIADLIKDLDMMIITTIDPTGIVSVIDAFAKPPCMDHTPMP